MHNTPHSPADAARHIRGCPPTDNPEVLFRRLLSDYQQALYWHIRHIVGNHEDAEDTLQETFVRVWRNISQLRDATSEKAWLYRIATNEALRHVETRRTTENFDDHQAKAEGSTQWGDAPAPDYDNIQQALEAAIASLPPRQRAVFCMRYYDELDYEAIARIADSNVKAVTANYHVAKQKIRQYLLAL